MAHPEVTADYVAASPADTTSFLASNPARWIAAYGAGVVNMVDANGVSRQYTFAGSDMRVGEWTAFTSTTCTRVAIGTTWPPPQPFPFPSAVNLAGGPAAVTGVLPAAQAQDWADSGTIAQVAFTAIPNTMHPFNFQNTANINFPKINAAINGLTVALLNLGTGATASTLVPSGTDSLGVVAAGVTAATAAGPTSLKAQRYTPNLTLGQWVPAI